MLRLAVRAGTIQIDYEVIKAMKEIRDGAAHPLENLVAHYNGVKKLAKK
jgi:hypothetical protein